MGLFGTLGWIVAVLCAVWVIYDVWSNQRHMKTEMKLVWTVRGVVFSISTAIVYYFVVKNK